MAPKDFKIDAATFRPVAGNAKMVLDSYSENALEVALQFREKFGGQITAICVGNKNTEEALRRALGFTADTAVRVWDPAWLEVDAGTVAHVLSRVIQKLGGADLILCGRQAGDVERGLVGSMLAEELGVACTTMVYQAEKVGNRLRLQRETDGGFQTVESRLPAVATITSGKTNVPRLTKVKDLIMASRKPITVLGAADLNLDPTRMSPSTALQELFIPVQNSRCEIIEGNDGPAKAVNLISSLRNLKIL